VTPMGSTIKNNPPASAAAPAPVAVVRVSRALSAAALSSASDAAAESEPASPAVAAGSPPKTFEAKLAAVEEDSPVQLPATGEPQQLPPPCAVCHHQQAFVDWHCC